MSGGEIRFPVAAGQFYEGSRSRLQKAVESCVGDYEPPDLGEVIGGVVPHAGWVFSGPTAGKVFVTLAKRAAPETVVLLGAVHRWGVGGAAVYPAGKWSTPLGEVSVDAELAAALVKAGEGMIEGSAAAHEGEHSIEVQVPFVQALCPDAMILPVAVPPGPESVRVGETVASVLQGVEKKAVVVASSDLTHYGMGYGLPDRGPLSVAMPWMRENDRRIIGLAESLRAEEIVPEAERHHNACGAGALAAAASAARALGATQGRTLEYTTSADVMPEPHADRAVGYVGMVFERTAT